MADLSSLRQSANGVSSEERSSDFAEYRQGRIPGSPGLDELRANANLKNAPSTIGVGSTRRILFTSDAGANRDAKASGTSQLEKGLEQVRKDKAAAVKSENYRLAHQLKGREKELLEELAAVIGRADGPISSAKPQEGAAKRQEGAQVVAEASKQVIQIEKGLTLSLIHI